MTLINFLKEKEKEKEKVKLNHTPEINYHKR